MTATTPTMDTHVNLADLPVEIISRIFHELDAIDLFNAGLTCRYLHNCSLQSIVWKSLYIRHYRFEEQGFSAKVKDYRERYITRFKADRQTDELVNQCILYPDSFEVGPVFADLYNLIGFNAKDRLLHHMATRSDSKDVLARKWWSNEMLLFLNRVESMRSFETLFASPMANRHRSTVYADVLVFYDMMLRRDGTTDQATIMRLLDDLVEEFASQHRNRSEYSTLDTAIHLARFMNRKGFQVPADSDTFYSLANSLISYTLQHPHHHGLPITHAAIYSALAHRLGFEATIMGYPGIVYSIVHSKDSEELIYLDITRQENWEVTKDQLIDNLRQLNLPPGPLLDTFLSPLNFIDFLQRVGRNMIACIDNAPTTRESSTQIPDISDPSVEPFIEETAVFYALMLLNVLAFVKIGLTADLFAADPRTNIQSIRRHIDNGPFWDHMLLHVLMQNITITNDNMEMPKAWSPKRHIKPRGTSEIDVEYDVGTVFHHARYGYTGVIVGWDRRCNQTSDWQVMQGVANLNGGSKQPFYEVV
jgi:F-box protein 21